MKKTHDSKVAIVWGWVLILSLILAGRAWATAPRFAPEMFGAEKTKLEIFIYEIPPLIKMTAEKGGPLSEVIRQALKVEGVEVEVKILPSLSLIKYSLINENAVAALGLTDLSDNEKKHLIFVPCYLTKVQTQPVSLIFNKKHPQGEKLAGKFKQGLKKLIESKEYIQILEKGLGKGQVSLEAMTQLKALLNQ
ncbi:MAG: hypothetical protein HQK57_06090 [Deltaproteobacteria bacterium]|nr:hypothetical protein [Deltaproteobacteria bacterium]MBF0523992.1 hypothetical protein [Deltaproteobacteria bacterium]